MIAYLSRSLSGNESASSITQRERERERVCVCVVCHTKLRPYLEGLDEFTVVKDNYSLVLLQSWLVC